LYSVLGRAASLIDRYGIDHLDNGRPIYILVDGDDPKSRIAFRDFNTNTRYEIVLSQELQGTGDETKAAFGIEVTLTYPDDRVRQLAIGRPGYFRDGVTRYRITQVLLSPDEESVVMVVEKLHNDGTIRYMVETAAL
jgi:predicted secreted protein